MRHNLLEATLSNHCGCKHRALGLRADVGRVLGASLRVSVREVLPGDRRSDRVGLARAIGPLILRRHIRPWPLATLSGDLVNAALRPVGSHGACADVKTSSEQKRSAKSAKYHHRSLSCQTS